MAEQIFLSDSRTAVDRKYVGFTPNGGSIKPVHVAGGAFRSIYGKYNATMSIKRLALVSDAKGVVPKGNELDTIYDLMKEGEKIEESVTPNALESLRNVMQRLLSADKGVGSIVFGELPQRVAVEEVVAGCQGKGGECTCYQS